MKTMNTRAVSLGSLDATFERRSDEILVRPRRALGDYPDKITAHLEHWAAEAPDRSFLARRETGGEWRHVSYRHALNAARAIGQSLLDRGLSAERPVVILSGNDIEHALLGLACLHVGIPYAPISTAYSLISTDHAKLRHIIGLMTPGLVFAADGAAYAAAIAATLGTDVEVVATTPLDGQTPFSTLLSTTPTGAVDAAATCVGPDTIAKILFTSGSTGMPKGVINTQRMLCSNQAMLQAVFPVLRETPPVLVDWLPWNHTFGGNHNVGLTLANGGTLYIDDGKPTPAAFAETVRNLREIAPTIYFNVPKGYEELVHYLEREPELRRIFFSRVSLLFYAAAGLGAHVWSALERLALETVGERIVMMTGLGATETAPFALSTLPGFASSGLVGLPAPGVELKLVPSGGKLEARLRGPNITPGYWRNPAQTAAAFDDEGYYCIGDALAFVDEHDWNKGFRFDGRISEDFKLSTGTWVSVGPMRAKVIAHLAPFARDAVITGHDGDFVGAIIIPDITACRAHCPDALDPLAAPALHEAVRARLAALAAEATGSSTRIVRVAFLTEAPSIDAGEITDKGSINQRAVIARRAELVAALHAETCAPHVLSIED